MRHYYGIEYAYGMTTLNGGSKPDRIFRFGTEDERIDWVNAGADFFGEPGYRDFLDAKSPAVRKAHRQANRGLDWRDGIPV